MDTPTEHGSSSANTDVAEFTAEAIVLEPEVLERFNRWAKGNQHLVNILICYIDLCQIPDDFVDADNEAYKSKTNRIRQMAQLMNTMLTRLPNNPVYRQHQARFEALNIAILAHWSVSSTWEMSENKERRIYAFVYRTLPISVVTFVAYLAGGWEHALQVTHEALSKEADGDVFEEWEKEHG